jgi:periplasmic divalent cation tolerance protein
LVRDLFVFFDISVQGKLAACVNIIPGIISVYEWEGKIENDDECLLMIKTRTSRIEDLTKVGVLRDSHYLFLTPYRIFE